MIEALLLIVTVWCVWWAIAIGTSMMISEKRRYPKPKTTDAYTRQRLRHRG